MRYEELDFDIAGIYSEAKDIMDDSFSALNCLEAEAPEGVQENIKSIMKHASEIVREISTTVADHELLG